MTLGIAVDAGQSLELTGDDVTLLAQEIRNPRAGTYRLTARVFADATSPALYEETFLNRFVCRLVLYQYKTPDKNPLERNDKYSWELTPPLPGSVSDNESAGSFRFSGTLDTDKPGTNFDIGNGLGIALLIEPKSAESWQIEEADAPQSIRLVVQQLNIEFQGRKPNEKVKV